MTDDSKGRDLFIVDNSVHIMRPDPLVAVPLLQLRPEAPGPVIVDADPRPGRCREDGGG